MTAWSHLIRSELLKTRSTRLWWALLIGVVGMTAIQAGVSAGDLVTEVNRRRVKDVAGVRAALEKGGSGANVLLRVQRGDVQQYVALSP